MKQLLMLSLSLLTFSSHGMATGDYYEIEKIQIWSDYTNGTFKVLLRDQDAASNDLCPSGYWLDGGDSKNSNVLSVALSAYHAKAKVRIHADQSQDWHGLNTKECKILLIEL
ncbi:hypothetical protein [Vibrio europaeus]|uniref:hypothetical protein n=1 Tax=Vibrio europaeus TaxID=300876 RepID=UPI00233F4362|nr:hypothetical protein [Vibrio europaeus]MDC5857419.1 hypothetical protein [Vibrio europaeus]